MILALLMFAYAIGVVSSIEEAANERALRFQAQLQYVRQVLRKHRMPAPLFNRVQNYLGYTHLYGERHSISIMDELPEGCDSPTRSAPLPPPPSPSLPCFTRTGHGMVTTPARKLSFSTPFKPPPNCRIRARSLYQWRLHTSASAPACVTLRGALHLLCCRYDVARHATCTCFVLIGCATTCSSSFFGDACSLCLGSSSVM